MLNDDEKTQIRKKRALKEKDLGLKVSSDETMNSAEKEKHRVLENEE